MKPRQFMRKGNGQVALRWSQSHGERLPWPLPCTSTLPVLLQALLPEDMLPTSAPQVCPAEGMWAGVFLMLTLLPSSSGSCDMENIVGSGTDVPGKFVFPGKNPCPVASATAPGPAHSYFWPRCSLCCSPHCALHYSSCPRLSHSLTNKPDVLPGLL